MEVEFGVQIFLGPVRIVAVGVGSEEFALAPAARSQGWGLVHVFQDDEVPSICHRENSVTHSNGLGYRISEAHHAGGEGPFRVDECYRDISPTST